MIFEWFVGFILGVVDFLLGWLPPADALDLPSLAPVVGAAMTLNAATGGFIAAAIAAGGLVLGIELTLFLFAIVRQAWSYVPLVGGR